jgi:hypothetical protein
MAAQPIVMAGYELSIPTTGASPALGVNLAQLTYRITNKDFSKRTELIGESLTGQGGPKSGSPASLMMRWCNNLPSRNAKLMSSRETIRTFDYDFASGPKHRERLRAAATRSRYFARDDEVLREQPAGARSFAR